MCDDDDVRCGKNQHLQSDLPIKTTIHRHTCRSSMDMIFLCKANQYLVLLSDAVWLVMKQYIFLVDSTWHQIHDLPHSMRAFHHRDGFLPRWYTDIYFICKYVFTELRYVEVKTNNIMWKSLINSVLFAEDGVQQTEKEWSSWK